MAIATDQQVQQYADQRVRRRAEQLRAMRNALNDDKLAIDDVYAHCAQQNPTWEDNRQDGPPTLLTPSDILDYNALISALLDILNNSGEDDATKAGYVNSVRSNWATVQAACVRPVND